MPLITQPKVLPEAFQRKLNKRLAMFNAGHKPSCKGLICKRAFNSLDASDPVDAYIIQRAAKLQSTAKGIGYGE